MKYLIRFLIFSLLISIWLPIFPANAQNEVDNGPVWLSASGQKSSDHSNQTQAKTITDNTLDVMITFPGVWAELQNEHGEDFTRLWHEEYGSYREPGQPALPGKTFNILIPNGAQVEVLNQTINSEKINLSDYSLPATIFPAQIQVSKSEPPPPWTKPDPQHYSSPNTFPQNWYELKDTFQMRDYTILPIWINPVRYSSGKGEIEILEQIELRLSWQTSSLDGVKNASISDSPSFDRLVSQIVINPPELPAYDTKEGTGEGYLIITPDIFYDELQPLVDLKLIQGYDVEIKKLSEITGYDGPADGENDDIEAIQNYIRLLDPSPVYLLLVGDTNLFPAPEGDVTNLKTDLYYATLNTNDFVPDIYIGRLPARTAEDVSNMVDKLIAYNTSGFQDYHINTSFIATCDTSINSIEKKPNYQIAEGSHYYVIYNHTSLLNYPGDFPEDLLPDGGDQLYCVTHDADTGDITPRIFEGRGLITYSGHGLVTGWMESEISILSTVIPTITEENKYSFISSFACSTNDFGNEQIQSSFGETWMLQQNKGAIGFIGSAAPSYWSQDDALERKFYDTLFENPSDPLATRIALTAGLTRVQELFPPEYDPYSSNGEGQYYWESYNLLGDPSQQLWLDPEYFYETKALSLAKDGLLNSIVRYPIEITNLGNTDSYSATIQDDEWPTYIDELTNLPYLSTGILWVNVKIPMDALVGNSDEIIVTVSSTSNTNLTTPFKITTTALETFFSHLPLISK